MSDYPAQRHITLIDVMGRAQPAYAANKDKDHLQAYAPFLHQKRQAAIKEIADDAIANWEDVAGGLRELNDMPGFETDDSSDENAQTIAEAKIAKWRQAALNGIDFETLGSEQTIEPCVVHADGRIECASWSITRAQVFDAFGLKEDFY